MIKEMLDLELVCNSCGSKNHNWCKVYFDSGVRLIQADRVYMTWCPNAYKHVFTEIEL